MSDKVEPGVVLVNPTGHIINEAGLQISPRLDDLRGKLSLIHI